VALVNNAQREHLEFMATVLAVAQENGSVITACRPTARPCFRPAMPTPRCGALAGTAPVMDICHPGATADVTATSAWADARHGPAHCTRRLGDVATTLRIAGQHNVRNALAAAGMRLAAGAPLAAVRRAWRRSSPWPGVRAPNCSCAVGA
jgi:UDP-N-acetylmuramoyl-tripeptide--D-alanyl-D-alanine ligase